jgi:hypothetical protein
MWKIFGNIIEMFIYASVYLLIAIVAAKIAAAAFSSDFERRITENSIG